MIGAMIVGLARSFTDVLLAGWHIVSLQRRNRYTSKIDIAVPPERVWDLITRRNVTYTALNMRYEQIPIEGREDLIVQSIKVGDRDLGRVGYEEIERTPPCLAVRYLAEHSDRPDRFGSDDVCAMCVHDGPNGGARFSVARELTHLTAATRIAAPIGVRMATHMVKLQAEHEAGIKPIAPGSSLVQAGLQQLMWTVAAIASFWLMFGWRDALVMAVVVAVHEAGHALAMLRYGLGVRIISFIPFFGGVAAPKRYYADQWQRGMVALAGVGFSLLPTLVLLAAAQQFESAEAAHWAALSAFINGFNLLPVPGLDGSIVTQLLLRRAPAIVGRLVALAFFAALVAFAVITNDWLIWIAVAFSLVVMVQTASLKFDDHLPPLSNLAALALLVLLCALLASYVWIAMEAVRLEDIL